jgi:predicted MPP superfamily phosphohydrolase
LAGIDDAHYYRADNIEKAASNIPDAFCILLSHIPEVYRHAAHAGFDLLLSGHTQYVVVGAAATLRICGLEVSRHGRVYVCRCWIVYRCSPH